MKEPKNFEVGRMPVVVSIVTGIILLLCTAIPITLLITKGIPTEPAAVLPIVLLFVFFLIPGVLLLVNAARIKSHFISVTPEGIRCFDEKVIEWNAIQNIKFDDTEVTIHHNDGKEGRELSISQSSIKNFSGLKELLAQEYENHKVIE